VFHEACLHTGKIFALLDGVDEISPDYTEKVFNLINALLEMKIKKLYISSRPEIAKDLETKYNEISYNLVPIPAADQWEYLMNYWRKHSNLKDEEILSRLAEKSIEKFKGSLITYIENDNLVVRSMTENETITSIPLFLNLVAEIINDELNNDFTENEDSLLQSTALNDYNLLQHFFEKKFEKYIGKTGIACSSVRGKKIVENEKSKIRNFVNGPHC
jgi:hypothetical protein